MSVKWFDSSSLCLVLATSIAVVVTDVKKNQRASSHANKPMFIVVI